MVHRGSRAVVALFALSIAAGCGSESSLVGAECSDGLVYVDDRCVVPTFKTFITPGDPPIPGGARRDDGKRTGPTFETGTSSVEPPVVGVVPPVVDPPVVPPVDPPVVPPVDPPVDPPIDPPLVCAAPLIECYGACIPVDSDPLNCGACGKICPSNICIAGECQGATPGDVVLIGHSYATASSASSQAKVLVNAMRIATTNPIRVLSFEAGALASNVQGAMSVAATSLAGIGRGTSITVSTSAGDLASPVLAASYDVVVVHGFDGDAASVGAQWKDSLETFTKKGGIVIALDDGSLALPVVLSTSGLLQVSGHTALAAAAHVVVSAPADAVGTQVLSPYASWGAPVTFQGLGAEGPDLAWVLREKTASGMGDAVVVHRIVRQ